MKCDECPYERMFNRILKTLRFLLRVGAILALIVILITTPVVLAWLNASNVLPNSLSESLFAYIGGIFGGLLSLAGVYLTIKSALKTRKSDLEIEYRPLLSAGVVDSKDRSHHLGLELFVLTNSSLFDDSHLEWLGESLLIENLGRGEVAEFTVGRVSCSPIFCPEGFILNGREWKVCKLFDSIPRVIPMNRSIEIHLGIPTPIDGITEKDFSLRLEYEVEMFARGVYSEEADRYTLNFCVDVRFSPRGLNSSVDSVVFNRDDARIQ